MYRSAWYFMVLCGPILRSSQVSCKRVIHDQRAVSCPERCKISGISFNFDLHVVERLHRKVAIHVHEQHQTDYPVPPARYYNNCLSRW